MGRLTRVFPGPQRPGDPAPPEAPVVDGVPDLTLPGRPRITRGLRPAPLPPTDRRPGWCWVGFDDEDGQCALL